MSFLHGLSGYDPSRFVVDVPEPPRPRPIRRARVSLLCGDCLGGGVLQGIHGKIICAACGGTGRD